MSNGDDLTISRDDLKALEELVEMLRRNYITAEQNLHSRALRLAHAVSLVDDIKTRNGMDGA